MSRRNGREPHLGDLMIVLLAGALAEVSDTLAAEGFGDAADFVGDLAEAADHYATEVSGREEVPRSSRLPTLRKGEVGRDGG